MSRCEAQTRDAVRDVRTTWVDAALRETRLGVRTLWATPVYSVPATVVLALGIAGTTAVFSVVDSVLLRPLPYPNASELVRVWSRNDERRIPCLSVSPADFEDWRARASALRQLGAYERSRVLQLRDTGEPVTVMAVTSGLFRTLRVAPAIGRSAATGSSTAVDRSHGRPTRATPRRFPQHLKMVTRTPRRRSREGRQFGQP